VSDSNRVARKRIGFWERKTIQILRDNLLDEDAHVDQARRDLVTAVAELQDAMLRRKHVQWMLERMLDEARDA
jgi:hypothetical protein